MKKAQDGFMTKAACRRGVCGKGSVSDKRAARMDKKDARRLDKETRKEEKQYEKEQRREEKYWRQSNLKKGGKIKKAIFGIGIGKEAREARRLTKQTMRNCNRGRCKSNRMYESGGVTKAQNGKTVSYTTSSGNKVTVDTSGYSAGKKKFPTKLEGQKAGLYGKMKPTTVYGMANRKNATRAISKSQGKPAGKVGINPTSKARKAFPQSKSGSKISKKK